MHEEASRIDAQIFYKLFKEISTGDYAQEDPLVSEKSVKRFRAAMSVTADSTKLSDCLSDLFPELRVHHQRPINRKSGHAKDHIDAAAVLKDNDDEATRIVVLLGDKKIDTDPFGSGRAQLHKWVRVGNIFLLYIKRGFTREYELLWNEDLPLSCVCQGSFPCLGLEINPYKAVLHGFVMCGERVLHSKLAAVSDEATDAIFLTFLRRLRGGVLALKKEWERLDYEMPFLDYPQFVPDRFDDSKFAYLVDHCNFSFEAYQGLSCGCLLNELASNAVFECLISTHKEENFAIKFIFGSLA